MGNSQKQNDLDSKVSAIDLEKQQQQQKQVMSLEKEILSLEAKRKRLQEEEKIMEQLLHHTFVKSENQVKHQKDIYDITIDVDSFNSLHNGWKIETNLNSLKSYQEKKDKNSCIISMMGNVKKGKSYVLSQITDEPLPHGYNISTRGLCLKYPTIHKNNIIIMDTPGLDFSPIFSAKNTKEEVEMIMKDKEKTIEFLQKFIILNSNIIVCVVGEMTIEDQKNIERIKSLVKTNQTVVIVHNLYTLPSIEKINEYLDSIISINKSNLQQNTYLKLKDDPKGKEENKVELNKIYYNETYTNNNRPLNLIHVILGNENTEAGYYFNKTSISFIRELVCTQTTYSKFPVFEKLKDFIVSQFPVLFGKEIGPDAICIAEDKKIYSKVDLMKDKGEAQVTLIVPKYCYYITNTEIIIRVECSNKVAETKIKVDVKGQNTIVKITGKKLALECNDEVNKKYSFSNILSGAFAIEIVIPLSDAVFGSKSCKALARENGYLQFIYPRMVNDSEDNVI